jgi:DNA topoisomerase-1
MSYRLIIVEKPDAARRVAHALADDTIKAETKRGIAFYTFTRGSINHIVVPAVGHLFTLRQKQKGWAYPVFEVEWVESYKVNKKAKFSKKYFFNIQDLAKKASEFIVATDYDLEGQIIAYNILRFICNTEQAKTMRFSTLTTTDLIAAYENMTDDLEWNMINAGITRHFLDYYYGINITRALTLALQKHLKSGFQILSTGRVQAPTLNLLRDKEKQIRGFQSIPYWQIQLQTRIRGVKVVALHSQDQIWEETEAQQIVTKCTGQTPIVRNIQKKMLRHQPPLPFNLTDLQTEAYRQFRFAPDRTLSLAQRLYINGFISYPRTSSQKLPAQINYRRILQALTTLHAYRLIASHLLQTPQLIPREGKKYDPAHISIYPTHEPPRNPLRGQAAKLYDLICKRFLATFMEAAIRERRIMTITLQDEVFTAIGIQTRQEGWYLAYYPYIHVDGTVLPEVTEGQELQLLNLRLLAKETRPPARYTQASLIRALETQGLGTRSTRSAIIRTLYNRNYLQGNIQITQLGEAVIEILQTYCPLLASLQLTREFEEKMDQVYNGTIQKEEVIQEAEQILTEILHEFQRQEDEIGVKLAATYHHAQDTDALVGTCPQCGHQLRIIYSKKTHKRFVGCEGYFQGVCSFSAPIPQRYRIQPTNRQCKLCGYPILTIQNPRKTHPWYLCINPLCSSKKTLTAHNVRSLKA